MVAVALAAAACDRGGEPRQETKRVVEAAFRQQIAYWLAGGPGGAGTVVCFALDERALRLEPGTLAYPSDAAARDGTECEARADGAVERSTGNPAVLVAALEVEWIARDEAWVTLRHYRSQYSSGTQRYRVVHDGSAWVSLGPIVKALPMA